MPAATEMATRVMPLRLGVLSVAAAALLLVGPEARAADPVCTPVRGTFTNVFLTGPEACPDSPIFLCTRGQLSGDLPGTYAFSFLTNEQTGTGHAPVMNFTGTSLVTTSSGTLSGQDFGVLRTTAFPVADFTTHLRITSGTGIHAGATGQLTIQGAASFATGQGAGTFVGLICLPG